MKAAARFDEHGLTGHRLTGPEGASDADGGYRDRAGGRAAPGDDAHARARVHLPQGHHQRLPVDGRAAVRRRRGGQAQQLKGPAFRHDRRPDGFGLGRNVARVARHRPARARFNVIVASGPVHAYSDLPTYFAASWR